MTGNQKVQWHIYSHLNTQGVFILRTYAPCIGYWTAQLPNTKSVDPKEDEYLDQI